MDPESGMWVRAIGIVRSEIRERKAMPPLGAPGAVEVFPEYSDGLLRLEKHSHLWVFGWLDRGERDVLQVTPRGVADAGPEGKHGVFAVRSPARPNPIGLTAARIVRREGLRIEFDRLDFMNGTQVLDLKPYFVARDAILSARNVQIGRPSAREALRESLRMQAYAFHGEQCGDLELAVAVVEDFRADALDLNDIEGWTIHAPIDRLCVLDALMGMTRATPGRGTLRLTPSGPVVFERGGAVWEYRLGANDFTRATEVRPVR